MTSEEFRKAMKAEPFKPFVVRLASGRRRAVPHPDFALSPPGAQIAVVWSPDDNAYEHIDLLLVESLEFSNRANGNGRRRKRSS